MHIQKELGGRKLFGGYKWKNLTQHHDFTILATTQSQKVAKSDMSRNK